MSCSALTRIYRSKSPHTTTVPWSLDVVGGPHLAANSITVPFSATKNTIGLSIGVLIDRGLLDLDATVASYWPEFAAKGKQQVTVRQLLSHQAGLLQTDPAAELGRAVRPSRGSGAAGCEQAVLAAGQRIRLPRIHDRQPLLGAGLPGNRANAARIL